MAAPATITVFDNLYDFAGNAIANVTVNCILNGTQETTSGGLISPKQQTTTTDGNGRFAFTVVANDLLSPVNSTYTIITPFRTYDIAPQSANGSSQQTTAANVIVNTPSPLAPATSNITGNLTISGTLTVSGLITGQAGETISAGTFSIPTGGFTMAGPLTLTAAASQVIPGATSFSVRDTGNANDNLLVTNAGNVTVRGSLTVTAGPLTVSAGGVTVTAGGLTVSAGGATITGNSTVTGTLTVSAALTIQAGGAAITGNSTVTGTLTATSSLTLSGAPGAIFMQGAGQAQIIGGTTGFAINNNANSVNNLILTDAGLVTLRNALTMPAAAGGAVPTTAYGTVPVKIDDQLLGVAAASVTFVNPLPTGFRHLLIEWYARGDNASVNVELWLRFNNISTATYDFEEYYAVAATNNPSETIGATRMRIGFLPAATATANYFGQGSAEVRHYQGAIGNKLAASRWVMGVGDATGNFYSGHNMGKWRTTATAITRLDLIPSAGNFLAGSLFTLWGIP